MTDTALSQGTSNPFVDPATEQDDGISDHAFAVDTTLAVGRDASLTLGTDSLIVLGKDLTLWDREETD